MDAYPSLSKKTYMYLNVGYSDSYKTGTFVFPKYRAGISIYRSLPKSFEAEIGARLLNFYNQPLIQIGRAHV